MSRALGFARRPASLLVVAVVTAVAALIAPTPRAAVAASTAALEVGYDGSVRPARPFPVQVTVTTDRLVRGTIEVRSVMVNGPSAEQEVRLPVEVPGGGAKRYVLIVPGLPPFGPSAEISARLLDREGRVLAVSPGVTARFSAERELVGLLAGARRGREVPGPAPLAVDTGVASFYAVDAEDLAAAPAALEPLGTILAGSGDVAAMADGTRRRFLAWLERGGSLVVDTPAGSKIAGLPAEWQPGPAGHHRAGLGRVIADPGGFASGDWSGRLFPTANAASADPRFGPFGGDSRGIAQTLADDAGVRVPQLGWLLLFLIAYALIVGPIMGLTLQRVGRAELAWVLIPLVAVLFTTGSWVAARGLRGRTHAAHVSVVEHSPAGATVASFVGVAARGNRETTISLRDGAWSTLQSGAGAASGRGPLQLEIGENGPAARLRLASGQFAVAGLRGPAPAGRGLTLTATSDDDGVARGVLRNNSDTTLEEVAVMVGDAATSVGTLGPGDEREWEVQRGQAEPEHNPFNAAEAGIWGDRFGRFGPDGPHAGEESSISAFSAWQAATPLAGVNRPSGIAVAVGWSKQPKSPATLDGRSSTRMSGRTAIATSTPVAPTGRLTDMTVTGQVLHGNGLGFDGDRRPGGSSIVRFVLPDGHAPSRPLLARVPFAQRIEAWVGGRWQVIQEARTNREGAVGEASGKIPVDPQGGVIQMVPGPAIGDDHAVDREAEVPAAGVMSGQVFLRITGEQGPAVNARLALWERA